MFPDEFSHISVANALPTSWRLETLSISHCRPGVDPAAAANATDQRSRVRRRFQNDDDTQHHSYRYPSEALGSISSPDDLRAGSSRDPTQPHGQGVNEKEGATGEDEDLWQPATGTIFPWSDGSRVCPELRYSKVEFVAILSTLLQRHHVEPRRQAWNVKEAARQRTLAFWAIVSFP